MQPVSQREYIVAQVTWRFSLSFTFLHFFHLADAFIQSNVQIVHEEKTAEYQGKCIVLTVLVRVCLTGCVCVGVCVLPFLCFPSKASWPRPSWSFPAVHWWTVGWPPCLPTMLWATVRGWVRTNRKWQIGSGTVIGREVPAEAVKTTQSLLTYIPEVRHNTQHQNNYITEYCLSRLHSVYVFDWCRWLLTVLLMGHFQQHRGWRSKWCC